MFLSLAVRETYVTETNFAARKQETVQCLRSKTVWLHGHKFCYRNIGILTIMTTILKGFQCCFLKRFSAKMADGEVE